MAAADPITPGRRRPNEREHVATTETSRGAFGISFGQSDTPFMEAWMQTTNVPIGIITLTIAALAWTFPGFAIEESKSATRATTNNENEKPPPVGASAENLLLNAGFEEGEKSPAEWTRGAEIDGVEYLWDKDHGQKGKASLCLNKSANRYFPIAQWYQIVERKAGSRELQVSAQVKAEHASKAIIDVIFLDADSKFISHEWASYIGAKEAKDPPATHDWKEYRGKVKIPQEARKIQIGLQIYGPGKVWFDEVRAEYVE
jgi:hypothetical protein